MTYSMNKLLLLTLIVLGVLALSPKVYAAGTVSCQPIYGGGQTCVQSGNVTINKMVANPQTGSFVDNLGVNDPKLAPDQTISFQLTITNNGGSTLSDVKVADIFPQFVSFMAGPGNFDQNNKVLTFNLLNLNPNESRTFVLTGKVASLSQLPGDQSVTCVVNQATAASNGQSSQDNAQFCIQKQLAVAPTQAPGVTKGGLKIFPPPQVVTTPPTGPEALALMALLPTGALGYFIRRKASRS